MLGLGAPEMMVLLLFLGGSTGADSLAAIDPEQYFTARQVDVSIDKMTSLAATAPTDARAQVMQLLALRYLAEHADKLKQADQYAAHRKVLEQIAAGKQAQDPQGFAKEYAETVLARIDGKTHEAPAAPAVPRIQEALAWFPADATIVGAADTRVGRGGTPSSATMAELLKKMPDRERLKLFEIVEKLGNVRLERFALAYVHDDDPAKSKIFVRYTGKANPAWLRNALRALEPNFEEQELKDPAGGRPIPVLRQPNRAPIVMFLSDTDIMMVGHMRDQGEHDDVAQEVLAVRARKRPSVLAGPLKARLKKVPARAIACVVGNLPEPMRKDLGGALLQFGGSAPLGVDAYVEMVPAGYDASATAEMPNGADAQAAVMQISKLRKQGIDALQQMLKQPDANPRLPVNALINVLESLQVQSDGSELRVRVLVPRDILQGVPGWFTP